MSCTSSHSPAADVGQTHAHTQKQGEDAAPDGEEEPMWEIRGWMLLWGRVRDSARCARVASEEQEFMLETR
jgi:hypothetical protein